MKQTIDRRDFLKTAGSAALVMGGLGAVTGCGSKKVQASNEELGGGEMTYRENAVRGDKVSILGYGCMRWPMTKDENGNNIIDQEAVNSLVDHAIASGINYFDTAPVYLMGQSERATANALKRYPRDSYYIATKLSNMNGSPSREAAMAMYKKSFEELQTDYIDYYLLHNVGNYDAFKRRFEDNGMVEFLLEERKAGRIRNLGFSFHGSQQGFDELIALHDKYHWDFVQIQLNYVDWTHAGRGASAQYLQGELDKKGIQSVIMEPLLGGRLANVPVHIAERLKERGPQNSIASWAFRFAGTHPGVLCVLSGMTYMEHLVDNLKSFSPLKPLTEEELVFLEETATLMQEYPTIPCTDCQYCMPCPYGIDIPTIFKHYNKCVNEGDIAQSVNSESYKKARRAYLVSYDRAVPKIRQASRCIGCGECTHHCPQHIRIPDELHKIDRYVENLKQDKL